MRALPPLPDMPSALTDLVRQIPPGRVSTYGRLAEALGDTIVARWVGQFLLHHDPQLDCASHRVIRATGHLGGYALGTTDDKAARLAVEGVRVSPELTVNLTNFGFERFAGDRPLRGLRALQRDLLADHSLAGRVRRPRRVGGVDVSYDTARAQGVAAYALVDIATGQLITSKTVRRPVSFPYISTYLAFRELPLLASLWEEVLRTEEIADVILVDGSGIMHPLRAGVATHFGIVADMPTIGVTKKLLCGTVNIDSMQPGEVRSVLDGRRKLGAAIRPHVKSKRPLFVSPGHLITTDSAIRTVVRTLRGRRLPEPIYWADRISRQEARR
jgi:deoxyribonuclease V